MKVVLDTNAPVITPSAPQVKARIVRSGGPNAKDTLCLKFSHVPTDGAAAKEGAYLLADIYRRLGEDPSWRPRPNIDGSRSARQISSRLWPRLIGFGIISILSLTVKTPRLLTKGRSNTLVASLNRIAGEIRSNICCNCAF